jgi:hypothetical protein
MGQKTQCWAEAQKQTIAWFSKSQRPQWAFLVAEKSIFTIWKTFWGTIHIGQRNIDELMRIIAHKDQALCPLASTPIAIPSTLLQKTFLASMAPSEITSPTYKSTIRHWINTSHFF